MDLFWLKGYASVTVSDLADAMAVQRSSFYNSFGTRESVFLEALRQYGAQSPDVVLDRLAPEAPVVPVLVDLLRTVCRVRTRDRRACGCLVFNSIAEVDSGDREVHRVLSRMLARRTRVVEHMLRRAVSRRELDLTWGRRRCRARVRDVPRGPQHALEGGPLGGGTLGHVRRVPSRLRY